MHVSGTPSFQPRDAATMAHGAQTPAADRHASPSTAAVAVEFPQHRHSQDAAIAELADFAGPEFHRFAIQSGVETRNFALPLPQYRELNGFTDANNAFIDVAVELGEQALLSALDAASIEPSAVDVIVSTTVTGIVVPSIEARIATRIGLRPDVKRVPLFGLGCVAGSAGVARMNDYLRAYPDQVAGPARSRTVLTDRSAGGPFDRQPDRGVFVRRRRCRGHRSGSQPSGGVAKVSGDP